MIHFLKNIYKGKTEWAFTFRLVGAYGLWKIISWCINHFIWLAGLRKQFNAEMGSFLAKTLATLGQWFGDPNCKSNGIVVYANGTEGLEIADHCLAIPATLIFAFSILLFPGPKWPKTIFFGIGIVIVQTINLLRLGGLLYLQKVASPAFLAFNHSYTYVFLSYGSLGLMLMLWMNYSIESGTKKDLVGREP